MTVHYEDGQVEEFVTRNGREFADYNGTADVPGSAFAEGIVRGGQQVRWFTLELANKEAPVERIVLTSFDNHVAPTIVSITAELPQGSPTMRFRLSFPTTTDECRPSQLWGHYGVVRAFVVAP